MTKTVIVKGIKFEAKKVGKNGMGLFVNDVRVMSAFTKERFRILVDFIDSLKK